MSQRSMHTSISTVPIAFSPDTQNSKIFDRN